MFVKEFQEWISDFNGMVALSNYEGFDLENMLRKLKAKTYREMVRLNIGTISKNGLYDFLYTYSCKDSVILIDGCNSSKELVAKIVKFLGKKEFSNCLIVFKDMDSVTELFQSYSIEVFHVRFKEDSELVKKIHTPENAKKIADYMKMNYPHFYSPRGFHHFRENPWDFEELVRKAIL